jgi:hypothetical protein
MMWSTLVCVTALSLPAGRADGLSLTNVRSTHGALGPTRADDKLLPGDALFVSFDIEGITVDDSGKVQYSIGTEMTDRNGKSLFKQDPRDLEATISLGGNQVPAYTELRLGLDHPPGNYTVKVTVTDRAAGRTQSFTRDFTVLEKDFGLVRLTTTSDQDGLLPVTVAGVGQPLWVNFGAVNFMRGGDNKQPDVAFEIRVLDENGKPTVAKPPSTTVNKDVPEKFLGMPMKFLLSLNRAGTFKVEITAKDQMANKTAKLTFPLTVHSTK